jgi:hypothetical protein
MVALRFAMVIKNEGMKSEENIKNGAGRGADDKGNTKKLSF